MSDNGFTAYALLLLAIGTFFLIIAYKDGYFSSCALTLKAGYKISWVDLGLFLWLVVMVLVVSPYGAQAILKTFPPLEKVKYREEIFTAFISQFNLLCFLFFSYHYHKKFWKFSLTQKHLCLRCLCKDGFFFFILSIPLIFLTNVAWRLVMVIYTDLGWVRSLQAQRMVEVFQSMDSMSIRLLGAFTAIVLAPVTEECIFRGAIYRFLKTKMTPLQAGVLSSVLFAGIHCNLAAFLPLFLLGLLLVKAYEAKGHIAVPIIFHGLFNFNTIFLLYFNESFY